MHKSNTDRPGGDPSADIGVLRRAIDEIDEKIMDLINQRLSLAKQIGDFKKQSDIQVVNRKREKEIISRLLKKNNGPLGDDGLQHIYAAIIAEGRNIQRTD
jgi:chorismate mutase/prephenate dehydratase